jgi:predicted  nucleic acid-binding Zn-ribbon protein
MTRDVSPIEPRSRERREVVRLLRRIQELSLEIADLRHREGSARDLDAKEHALDQLRWRLAALARRSASDDLDAAA